MSGGYDYEVVGEPFEDVYCAICMKLMRDPVQLECGHGMCATCFRTLSESANTRWLFRLSRLIFVGSGLKIWC